MFHCIINIEIYKAMIEGLRLSPSGSRLPWLVSWFDFCKSRFKNENGFEKGKNCASKRLLDMWGLHKRFQKNFDPFLELSLHKSIFNVTIVLDFIPFSSCTVIFRRKTSPTMQFPLIWFFSFVSVKRNLCFIIYLAARWRPKIIIHSKSESSEKLEFELLRNEQWIERNVSFNSKSISSWRKKSLNKLRKSFCELLVCATEQLFSSTRRLTHFSRSFSFNLSVFFPFDAVSSLSFFWKANFIEIHNSNSFQR